MKRSKKRVKQFVPPKEAESIQLHLCHVCLFLNESSKTITKCQNCDHLLSFGSRALDYLEKEELWDLETAAEEQLAETSQEELEAQEEEEEELFYSNGRRKPTRIMGLSVLW